MDSVKGFEGVESVVFQKEMKKLTKISDFSGKNYGSGNEIEDLKKSLEKMMLESVNIQEKGVFLREKGSEGSYEANLNDKDVLKNNKKDSNFRNIKYYEPKDYGLYVNGKAVWRKNYDEYFVLSTFISHTLKHIMPTNEEISQKERFRFFLSEILNTCRPSAKLVLFGSVASGLAIVNSDMDFCVMDDSLDLHTDEFLKIFSEEIKKYGMETTLLFRTRVSIIKVNSKGSFNFPQGISCDIGFNNKLAIYNTKLLATYSKCDHRVRKIILFVKYWAKRRKINDPYHGTLSSYGYVLLILHYLINIVPIPLLPNLQQMKVASWRSIPQSEIECDGYNVWFYKDIDISCSFSNNTDSLGKLVYGFFYYYAYQFNWKDHVVSIRTQTGLLTKQEKGWTQAMERVFVSDKIFKDRYILAIEDPFEITHNVGRTVNKQSSHIIRGEFFRASKLSSSKLRKKIFNELCEERIIINNFSNVI